MPWAVLLGILAGIIFLAGIIASANPPEWFKYPWAVKVALFVGALALGGVAYITVIMDDDNGSTLSEPEYKQRTQRVACDILAPARDGREVLEPLAADVMEDPGPENIRRLLLEFRQFADRAQPVIQGSVFDLSPVVPPEKYREDHELHLGSLKVLESALSDAQIVLPEDIDGLSDEELLTLLIDRPVLDNLISILSALVTALANQNYSSEFQEISTCQADSIATRVAPTIGGIGAPAP